VDREKERIYEQVMNEYRSEISKKNEKISEMERESSSHLNRFKKAIEEENDKEIHKSLSEMRI